jgi:hypothetical protein
MMITVNIISDRITGSVNGQTYSIAYEENAYEAMKALANKASTAESVEEVQALIKEFMPYTVENYSTILETACPYLVVNPKDKQVYLRVDKVVSTAPMPPAFAEKLIKAAEKKLSVDPIIKAWARFLRHTPGRPKYTLARGQAFANYISATYVDDNKVRSLMADKGLSQAVAQFQATTTQVSLTEEGCIVGYKVSTEITTKFALDDKEEVVTKSRYPKQVDEDTGLISYDMPDHVEDRRFEPRVMGQGGDAFHCTNMITGADTLGHLIRVGHIHWLDSWSQVGEPGCKGLHCGGLDYIKGYQSGGTVTHNIIIDPADIGYIYENRDCAITVKRYLVHSSFAGVNKNMYHSSKYAASNDAEYKALVLSAIETQNAEISSSNSEALSLV